MNNRTPNRPRLVATAARRGPALIAVVLVRLDVSRNLATFPRSLRSITFPEGTNVRIDVGDADAYLDAWNELVTLVRDCAEIEIVGTSHYGVSAVRNLLARRLPHVGASAC